MVSLAYPIDRLDWALFSVVILFHHRFPLLETIENRSFILPQNFPAVLMIFAGQGAAGNPPSPQSFSTPKFMLQILTFIEGFLWMFSKKKLQQNCPKMRGGGTKGRFGSLTRA